MAAVRMIWAIAGLVFCIAAVMLLWFYNLIDTNWMIGCSVVLSNIACGFAGRIWEATKK